MSSFTMYGDGIATTELNSKVAINQLRNRINCGHLSLNAATYTLTFIGTPSCDHCYHTLCKLISHYMTISLARPTLEKLIQLIDRHFDLHSL